MVALILFGICVFVRCFAFNCLIRSGRLLGLWLACGFASLLFGGDLADFGLFYLSICVSILF